MTVEVASDVTLVSAGSGIVRRNRPGEYVFSSTSTYDQSHPLVQHFSNEKCPDISGTCAQEFSTWQEEKFEEMDSTLAVQQYIQQIIR